MRATLGQWISQIGMLALLSLLTLRMNAAELKPETVQAWDSYVQSVETGMQARLAPGQTFLWADEDQKRQDKLRHGLSQVAPVDGKGYKPVPNGLIHDWVGAIFIPNTSIAELMTVARDYDHYKEIYKPLVVDSKAMDRSGDEDRFSMRWVHKALFVTAAVDAEYCSRLIRVSDHKFYSTISSTRIQEIQDYGNSGEHKIPAGQGSGFIWKLYSVTRYEERDGGVYVEIEAVVLTRDIPASLRVLVKPIVTKLSRNSLLVSLDQTRDAVRSRAASKVALQVTQKKDEPARNSGGTTSFAQR